MRFSPFNPIQFFIGDIGDNNSCEKDYVQSFATHDNIMLEVFHDTDEILDPLEVYDTSNDNIVCTLVWKRFIINSNDICSVCKFSGLSVGVYLFVLGVYRSYIQILADDELEDTVLIQYANSDNKGRDDIYSSFLGNILYFELRIKGGFKESGWIFHVDNSQFTTPMSDIVELCAFDYTDKVLTIGSSSGIPTFTADLLNRILSCQIVFVDGTRYSRSGEALLESDSDNSLETYVYTITLRESQFLNAKFERKIRLNLRRVPNNLRKVNNYLRRL